MWRLNFNTLILHMKLIAIWRFNFKPKSVYYGLDDQVIKLYNLAGTRLESWPKHLWLSHTVVQVLRKSAEVPRSKYLSNINFQ